MRPEPGALTAVRFPDDLPLELHREPPPRRLRRRRFLLGEITDSGPYQHHIFFMDIIASGQGVPKGFNVYMLRSVDGDVAHTSAQLAIYTKLPAILFWSAIEPPAPSGFSGTALGQSGVIGAPQRVENSGFAYFLANRSAMASRLMEGMSPKQQTVINEWYKANRERVLHSETWKAQLADAFWSRVTSEQ